MSTRTWDDDEIRHVLGEGRVLRDDQIVVIQQVLAAWESKKFVILSAPTGSGKSFIGRALSKIMGKTGYITPTKTLQDQLHRDFPEGQIVKGHLAVCGSREGLLHREKHRFGCGCTYHDRDTGGSSPRTGSTNAEVYHNWSRHDADLDDLEEVCPYMVAKIRASLSSFYIANVAVFINDCRNPIQLLGGRRLMIMDECDTLYDDLDGQVNVYEVTLTRLAQTGFDPSELPPPANPGQAATNHIQTGWAMGWAAHAIEEKLAAGGLDHDERKKLVSDARYLREIAAFDDPGKYVYTWDVENDEFCVRLISPGAAAATVNMWASADKFLLMSASVVNARNWARNLGIASDDLEIIDVESTFPVENRVIGLIKSGVSMAGGGFKTHQKLIDMADVIAKLLDTAGPDDRALVLVSSGAQSADLRRELEHRVPGRSYFTYGNGDARGRSRALDNAAATPGSVLIGQSLHRGVDLKGDLCRLLVVAKLPWPYLGDRMVAQRSKAKGFEGYIQQLMVADVVQSVGRGVRGPEDWCRTFVVDHSDYAFTAITSMSPAYVREAVKVLTPR